MNRIVLVAGALTAAVVVFCLGRLVSPFAAGFACGALGVACVLAGIAMARRDERAEVARQDAEQRAARERAQARSRARHRD